MNLNTPLVLEDGTVNRFGFYLILKDLFEITPLDKSIGLAGFVLKDKVKILLTETIGKTTEQSIYTFGIKEVDGFIEYIFENCDIVED